MIDISNCFPMTLMNQAKEGSDFSDGDALELAFDTDYVKKMIKFHKTVNDKEQFLGCYISTTSLNKQSMAIVQYFIELLNNKVVNSPLITPIVLMFDPELNNNKLDIKVLNIHSVYLQKLPMLSEMPFKFNLENYERSGLDVLFYGQEYYDTNLITDGKRQIDQ
jgi:hypothetical protein